MSESPNLGLLILTLTRDVTTKGWGSLLTHSATHSRILGYGKVRIDKKKKKKLPNIDKVC
jgi:hypothetical protein